MSTKKDKFSSKDKNYMKIAIDLAKARKGLTGENPSVGCVIVKNDKIISIGQTGYNGRPHAESNAISSSFQNLVGSKCATVSQNLQDHALVSEMVGRHNDLCSTGVF